jgi:acetate kinase
MAATLGGLDILAFTGGVGERSPAIRSRAAARLGFLGVRIDEGQNADPRGDVEITGADAEARTVVVHAREDLEIARQCRELVHGR